MTDTAALFSVTERSDGKAMGTIQYSIGRARAKRQRYGPLFEWGGAMREADVQEGRSRPPCSLRASAMGAIDSGTSNCGGSLLNLFP